MAPIDPDQAPAAVERSAKNRYLSGYKADIVVLKERFFNMLKKDLIVRNPLRLMGHEADDVLGDGQFGAVLARAGVGKTAFLVQLALNKMLREKNVLHISLEDPVGKVNLWYAEVWRNIARQYQASQTQQLWESLIPHRFIMTFRVEGFSVPKLEERLNDLTEQGIFSPRMLIIDGLPFDDESVEDSLTAFRRLATERGLHAWFTMLTHRHEAPGQGGLPRQLERVQDRFEVAVQLVPGEERIEVIPLKGGPANPPRLCLDPTTMLIQPGN